MIISEEAVSNILARRFGTSERLMLSNREWLRHGMGAKTVNLNASCGGLAPSVNWEDRSAAIALIKNRRVKALASLLCWGGDLSWDRAEPFDKIVDYLAARMLSEHAQNMPKIPKGSNHTLDELAHLIARMTLHFELYQLWSIYTVEGQLFFSGIKIPAGTYSQKWRKYQNAMLDDLEDLAALVDADISQYRFNLG